MNYLDDYLLCRVSLLLFYPHSDADEWRWYDETISFVSEDGVFQICRQLWTESPEDDSVMDLRVMLTLNGVGLLAIFAGPTTKPIPSFLSK